MKYITQVFDNENVKHIVDANGKNVEVIALGEVERYGNKAGESVFRVNGILVTKDLQVRKNSGSDYVHLAELVFSIELVRFVIEHLTTQPANG